jgi:hypothetical protein
MSVYLSSANERRRSYAMKVIHTYIDCRTAPRIVAMNPDDSARSPLKWTPDSAHYQRDVELATEAALPRPESRSAFWRFVARLAHGLVSPDHPLDRMTSSALTRAGKLFIERKLLPTSYFRRARV